MSLYEDHEFEQFLVAHANKDLTPSDRDRLQTTVGLDERYAIEIEGVNEVHRLFDVERGLFSKVMAPVEPAEEANETYQAIARAAASGEEELRVKLMTRTASARGTRGRIIPLRRNLWASAIAVAAVLVVALVLVFEGGTAPTLNPNTPDAGRLGPESSRIIFNPEVTMASREVSWNAVIGARTYDVVIEDVQGKTFFSRSADRAASITWTFTKDQYRELSTATGPLYLRVVARDGAGVVIASSGDLQLSVR